MSILAVTLAAGSVYAKDKGPHDKAIKARQALMQIYGFNNGILGAMAKGKMPYDAEMASDAAANLLSAVSMRQGALWPQGSDSKSKGRKNRASAKIWTTYPKIAEAGKAMNEAATKMNDVAGNGLDALKGAMGDVGQACKGCHTDFRTKKK